MKDLHNNIKAIRAIPPVAVGTTGTGQTGKVIDRRGYNSVEFIVGYGAITATGAVFTVTVKEGDATGAMTSVADADLLGTEAGAGIAAGTPRTSNVNKLVTKRVGYRGNKRYVQCDVKSTATAGTPISVTAILGDPEIAPVAT
jgi:hypothetical protein